MRQLTPIINQMKTSGNICVTEKKGLNGKSVFLLFHLQLQS